MKRLVSTLFMIGLPAVAGANGQLHGPPPDCGSLFYIRTGQPISPRDFPRFGIEVPEENGIQTLLRTLELALRKDDQVSLDKISSELDFERMRVQLEASLDAALVICQNIFKIGNRPVHPNMQPEAFLSKEIASYLPRLVRSIMTRISAELESRSDPYYHFYSEILTKDIFWKLSLLIAVLEVPEFYVRTRNLGLVSVQLTKSELKLLNDLNVPLFLDPMGSLAQLHLTLEDHGRR
jgi:hypothetical protein